VLLSTSVRHATAADAEALAGLVNAAFAIEEFFVDGDRTSAAEIAQMMQSGIFLVLDHADGRIAAAVYVEHRGYFGMLSVLPELQGHGLGKRLVRIAEALCEAAGCATMSIRIINLRDELGRWYRSLGYREIGVAPYTHRTLKRPAHFVEMQRSLAA
jgi:ribosomal protein S18 acetylase RimI-like enzyme